MEIWNPVLISACIAWLIAQLSKIVLTYFKEKKLDFTRLVGSGGMPSSHSAFVTAAAVCTGQMRGYGSVEFGIMTVIAFIVMYDAAGLRRAAGKQAKLLNEIIQHLHETEGILLAREKMIELLGHTPVQVIVGALLGVAIALAVCFMI